MSPAARKAVSAFVFEALVAELPEADQPEASVLICASTALLGGKWVA
jgi:hypothetical protein